MSWLPLARVGGVLSDAKAASEAQEQAAVDLDAPVAKQWVELKREIIDIADDLGIGPEVEAVFDVLKAKYTGEIAVAAYGTAGSTITMAAFGGFAAGVVGGVIVAALTIFGGSDEAEAQQQYRRNQIRAACWRMLIEPTMGSLAVEQDDQAKEAAVLSKMAPIIGMDPAPYDKTAKVAVALAKFYRLAGQTLSPSEQKLFLSVTWLSRLYALKKYVGGLSTTIASGWSIYSEKEELLLAFPDIDSEIAARIKLADAKVTTLAAKPTKPKKDAGALASVASLAGWLIPLGVGAGALYYFKPALAKSLAAKGTTLAAAGGKRAYGVVDNAVGQTADRVRKALGR